MESESKETLDRSEVATVVVVWLLNLFMLAPFLYGLALLLLSYCTGFGSEETAATSPLAP